MVAYIDNDAVHKLAAFDLTQIAFSVLDISHDRAFVLPTAKYKFGLRGRPRRTQRDFGAEVLTRIEAFLSGCNEVGAPELEDVKTLVDSGLDQGEAILISISHRIPGAILVTGDKRALRQLAQEEKCASMAAALSGRVECVEQIVLRAMAAVGFIEVRDRVVRGMACDTSIRAAFGSGRQAVQSNVVAALEAYIAEVRRNTGTLLRL